ncbi:M28 family peptidase [Dinghuibacter silviterrae]|uniref:Zn-dependent M28 family amino/carboxypeptidase n=1 Tax=Dinghuibacter silviterrae TaxID=1539049 RepID=A0A4R8DRW2_9BACT|nr:M28 family peptidase [Dinghuibacter silviterrae]TDX00729.1 Zn-dependent M28 family amino/carboxypeptidase [Dinghuibacter silviterrae]
MNCKIPLLCLGVLACPGLRAQKHDTAITVADVTRTEAFLSSDAMRGRAVFTPDINRAADYIAGRFREAGLKPGQGNSYFQDFSLLNVTPDTIAVTLNGTAIDPEGIGVMTSHPDLDWTILDSAQVVSVDASHSLGAVIRAFRAGHSNVLVLLDTISAKTIRRNRRFLNGHFYSPYSLVMVPFTGTPASLSLHIHSVIKGKPLRNVVGMLPGHGPKAREYVMFSAHYDHLGVGQPDAKGDSIYNGANDDASGTTAVLTLAHYFAARHDNQRTIVFATFTAEEIGEYGSQYFATQWDPATVVAMFNIEMIGTTSKWGANSAYITGYKRTDFGKILQKNLEGTGFQFYPDPYTTQNLFFRSDNASLASVGVPAHTISTSKMDNEPYYHKQGDEISTLDMENMTRIIRSIALSSVSIVQGVDTPTRVTGLR